MYVIEVDNVSEALHRLVNDTFIPERASEYRHIAPRGGEETYEWLTPVATVYRQPRQRVLRDARRDANPYFHFFEALWMLAGGGDVATPARFNSTFARYSDDGNTLHGAYGFRWREHFGLDQLWAVIELLQRDPLTRRAVLSMWDPRTDLGMGSNDIPCNTTIYFKLRDAALHMTVCCRSNDALWGAYGANAVHFSYLQEFVAGAVGAAVGRYTQVSDSFHVYLNNPAWARFQADPGNVADPYLRAPWRPYALYTGCAEPEQLLLAIQDFVGGGMRALERDYTTGARGDSGVPFIEQVATPLYLSWYAYKALGNFGAAQAWLANCAARDWATAASEWLARRQEKRDAA